MAEQEVGVVVVGLGIAGKVRVRDLEEKQCPLRLRGVVSRRKVDENLKAFSLEEALSSKDVDAIIICTEPAKHEEYVEKCLQSGKHVLVEYPVALSSEKAQSLYNLAEKNGLVLVEENIALLTDGFRLIQEKIQQKPLKSVEFSLCGRLNGWIEKVEESGLPFVSGVSSLQVMYSIFPEISVTGGRFEKHEDGGYKAEAFLKSKSGIPVHMVLTRAEGLAREKKTIYVFTDGESVQAEQLSPKNQKPGLFMKDLFNFHETIVEGKASKSQVDLSVQSLKIAENIHAHFK